ncbi:hypothetical protein HMPREF1549_01161 [Actinomyces johnsonii F0510]|uniref:Uncharacterized protein n=1 Tax=Actinomyces johnsonii F0510 TaxID=1227262 RepID=U1QE00_9ACTO|nr:hypothetical protein HMPREF1549_01161 [Actinomyces johnsonii F0510]
MTRGGRRRAFRLDDAHPRSQRLVAASARPLCCLMTSESLGVMTPQGTDTAGPIVVARCAGRGCPRLAELLAAARMAPDLYCTRVGDHWRRVGCTPGRWGLRAVRTTPDQWIPALVD